MASDELETRSSKSRTVSSGEGGNERTLTFFRCGLPALLTHLSQPVFASGGVRYVDETHKQKYRSC